MHDVEKPVQIIVGAARPGENGPLQFTLPRYARLYSCVIQHGFDTLVTVGRPRSPIFGSKVLSDAEAFLLYDQVMYFLVQSVQYPRGEVRFICLYDKPPRRVLTIRMSLLSTCIFPASRSNQS